MSNYNTDLKTNNTNLQNILDTINNLPEAGSGGSSGVNIEACTVNVKVNDMSPMGNHKIESIYVMQYQETTGTMNLSRLTPSTNNFTINDVVSKSIMVLVTGGNSGYGVNDENKATLLYSINGSNDLEPGVKIIGLQANQDDNISITITYM